MRMLQEMRTHWSHAFRTRPVRATLSMFMWVGMVVLGALAVFSIVYIVSGHGLEKPPAEPTRRDREIAARYGRLSSFMTDEERERQRAYEDDEQAERKVLLGVATALPDPPGAEIVYPLAGSRRRGFVEQFCMPGEPSTAATVIERHYAALGWLTERYEDARGRWAVSGKFDAGRFIITAHPISSSALSCSESQTHMVLRVFPW